MITNWKVQVPKKNYNLRAILPIVTSRRNALLEEKNAISCM